MYVRIVAEAVLLAALIVLQICLRGALVWSLRLSRRGKNALKKLAVRLCLGVGGFREKERE